MTSRLAAPTADAAGLTNSPYVQNEIHNTGAGWEMTMWKMGLFATLLALLVSWGLLAYLRFAQTGVHQEEQRQEEESEPSATPSGEADEAFDGSSWASARSLLSFCLSFGKLVNILSALLPRPGK